MATGPGLFSDIGKKAKDLLTRDYISDQKFSVSTLSNTGLNAAMFILSLVIPQYGIARNRVKLDVLTPEYGATSLVFITTFSHGRIDKIDSCGLVISLLNMDYQAITSSAVKSGGLSIGQVAGIYVYNNALINVQVDTASNIMTSVIITDIIPSTKTMASLMFPNYSSSGKLQVQYNHHHATFTAASALSKNPVIDVSATVGTAAISFGVEAGYDTTSGNLTKCTAGISVKKPECCASIILSEKGDAITAAYLHHLDETMRSAAVGELSRKMSTNENMFTVGGSYAIDQLTVVKAKFNNNGKVGAILQHEMMPKSVLTLAAEFDTKALEKTPRFGVALALSP